MATQAMTPTKVPTNSAGLSAGVTGVAGASAGMTAGVAGAGNGWKFPNRGGEVIGAFLNTGAGARTITPVIAKTRGGVAPTSPTRSIAAGAMVFLQFDSDMEDADGYVTVEAEHAEVKALFFY